MGRGLPRPNCLVRTFQVGLHNRTRCQSRQVGELRTRLVMVRSACTTGARLAMASVECEVVPRLDQALAAGVGKAAGIDAVARREDAQDDEREDDQ
jgi:hypothetical protein